MRKLAVLSGVAFALTVGATSVFAATPSPSPSPVATPAVSHTWVANAAKRGTLSGSARLTLSSTYGRGTLWVRANGDKKGDLLVVRIIDHTKSTAKTIVLTTHKVLKSNGSTTFTFGLSAADRAAFKAAMKAGDSIAFRLTDGKTSVNGIFHKA